MSTYGKRLWHNRLCFSAMRSRLRRVAKEPISGCDIGSFASRKAPYHAPIKPISHADMVLFAKRPRLRRVMKVGNRTATRNRNGRKSLFRRFPIFYFKILFCQNFLPHILYIYSFSGTHRTARSTHRATASASRTGAATPVINGFWAQIFYK